MNKTKKICILGMLSALYVVMSLTLKINLIGNISLDLGYIALAFGCILFGPLGVIVGCIGCALESIMFSAYGFSISWFIGNFIIGLGCGFTFKKSKNTIVRIISIIIFTFLGIGLAKTGIECYLYSIPFSVKIIKNLVAFGVDSAVMIAGTLFGQKVLKNIVEKC